MPITKHSVHLRMGVVFALFITVTALMSAGCRTTVDPYKVAVLPDSGQIHQSTQHRRLSLEYTVFRDGNQVQLRGTLRPGWRDRALNYFVLYAAAVDSEGNQLERYTLVTLGGRITRELLRFEETFAPPPGTVGLAFGYYGETLGGNDNAPRALMGVFPAPVR